MTEEPRVVIVADHASLRFGGEASLPLHYFIGLRRRGIEAWLIVHERTRDELSELLGEEIARVSFIPDRLIHSICWKLSRLLPAQLSYFTFGWMIRLSTQLAAKRLTRSLVINHGATVVHQPTPVSPREPSLLYDIGAPVIIGPMNGNMTYPAGFRGSVRGQGILNQIIAASRLGSALMHRVLPGKLHAQMLLVSNARTYAALPKVTGRVAQLVENGVDTRLWVPQDPHGQDSHWPYRERPPNFLFIGRLVDWKAVDIVILAMARLADKDATLEIVGDGPMRPNLEVLSERLGLRSRLHFCGWLSQKECVAKLATADALLLPSIYECGGAVVLEAMSCARPVIATAWGGPLDYLDDSCGILVPPTSREALIAGFATAMDRLAAHPELRDVLGQAGHSRIRRYYSWDEKVDVMLGFYREVSQRHSLSRPPNRDLRRLPIEPSR